MFGPWKIDQGFWVAIVGFAAAAVCLVAIIVLSIREKRRTGHIVAADSGTGWFKFLALGFLVSTWQVSTPVLRLWPFCLIAPAVLIALLVAFTALALRAFIYAFLDTWQWRVGFWITSRLVWPAVLGVSLYRSVVELKLPGWIWFLAGLVAAFLAPFFTRFAFQDEQAQGQAEPDTSQKPDFRLWRPGNPE